MIRSTTAARPLSRGLANVISARAGYGPTIRKVSVTTQFHSLAAKRPQVASPPQFRPVHIIPQLRYVTKTGVPKHDKIDVEAEKKIASAKLESNPEAVTTDSSVRQVFESSQAPAEEDNEVLRGVKDDFQTIKDSFALREVPRESYYLGAAGTLPYMATSLATLYLSYGINHVPTGSSLFFPLETAQHYLSILEPIQIGYGAVILSFLGAIHWGLEYAGYGGHQGMRRFAIGCAMPAIAWPTMLMPLEPALITQFIAFTGLYFVDSRQGVRGFAPPWYPTYRFVLTFIVGISIVASLIGRGQVQFVGSGKPTRAEKLRELSEIQPQVRKEEEEVKSQRRAAEAAEEERKNNESKSANNGKNGEIKTEKK
ncbi:hypothetical protein V496_07690 [Pseudogymnoascus sp. VKM F-4515 (FW-2607)]|nr:hypothetical protein V496_07690 [Pseudogymnoascus sp. VKM F-4515 (FW-2607)]KFY91736.1 hypothetical protein V498_05351 [Pseudogymnoascus sp. VKM F-4517 (FW-2822)]